MWSIGVVCVSEVVSLDHLLLYVPFAHDICPWLVSQCRYLGCYTSLCCGLFGKKGIECLPSELKLLLFRTLYD